MEKLKMTDFPNSGMIKKAIIDHIPFSLIFFIFSFGTLAIFINSNDTNEYGLQQTGIEAIVERGHVYLEGSQTPQIQPKADFFTYKGHNYAAKQPGLFFIGSIPYFFLHKVGITYQKDVPIAGGFVTLFTSILMTALMMVLLFHIAVLFTSSKGYSALIACFFGFGTTIFPYSGITHHDIYGTFFSFLAFFFLFYNYRMRKKPRNSLLLLGGFFAGFALFSSMLSMVNVIIVALYVLAQRKPKHVLLFCIGFLVGILPVFIFNWVVFDHPLNFYTKVGNFSDVTPRFSIKNVLDKLYFYLLSPTSAILFFSPVFVLGLLGFVLFPRRYRIEKIILPLTFFLLLAHLSTLDTVGHMMYGPRYLLPSMPFILIGLCGFFAKDKTALGARIQKWRLMTPFIVFAGIISIIINTAGSMIGTMRWVFNRENAFVEYMFKIITADLPDYHFASLGIFLIFVSLILHYLKYSEEYKKVIYKVL